MTAYPSTRRAQRLRVDVGNVVEPADKGFECELTWRWADWGDGGTLRTAVTKASGATKVIQDRLHEVSA